MIVEAVAADLAGRIGREQLVPAAAPDVVEGRAGVGRAAAAPAGSSRAGRRRSAGARDRGSSRRRRGTASGAADRPRARARGRPAGRACVSTMGGGTAPPRIGPRVRYRREHPTPRSLREPARLRRLRRPHVRLLRHADRLGDRLVRALREALGDAAAGIGDEDLLTRFAGSSTTRRRRTSATATCSRSACAGIGDAARDHRQRRAGARVRRIGRRLAGVPRLERGAAATAHALRARDRSRTATTTSSRPPRSASASRSTS